MKKIYAVFEDYRIVRMSENKQELIEYINSFNEERSKLKLAEKIIRGPREYQQSHWLEVKNE